MERKYYLRGLGLGIVVTAVIMGIVLSDNGSMTDSEIIARAKELGMVENTVLSSTDSEEKTPENTDAAGSDAQNQTAGERQDIVQAGQNEAQNTPAADNETQNDSESQDDNEVQGNDKTSGDAVTTPETESGEDAGEKDEKSNSKAEEEAINTVADDEETGESEDDNTVITAGTVRVITINSGDSSYTVAKKLADVGVVTSAATFDTFLCENGYDKRIRTGTFSIPTDASDEQIARIVSGLE